MSLSTMPKRARSAPVARSREFKFPLGKGGDGKAGSSKEVQSKPEVRVWVHESLSGAYGLYVWPSALLLADYLWHHPGLVSGRRVLELGAGTGLPGLCAAKMGASHVTLTDGALDPLVMANLTRSCARNGLPKDSATVMQLRWGEFGPSVQKLRPQLILGADVLYDSDKYDDILATVAYFIEFSDHPEEVSFLCAVQRRSDTRPIHPLLSAWGLRIDRVNWIPKSGVVQGCEPTSVRLVRISAANDQQTKVKQPGHARGTLAVRPSHSSAAEGVVQ